MRPSRSSVPADRSADNVDLRRAMALALDRKSFIEILSDGKARIGGAMLPPPEGLWGMPTDMLETLPGYGPDVQKNRAEARDLMKKLGYGPEKRFALRCRRATSTVTAIRLSF
jgi:peptide/nickel transport system substrate-binding protein